MAKGKRPAHPLPSEEKGGPHPYPLPGPAEATSGEVLTGPGRGSRRSPGKGEGEATAGSPPLRVPDTEATNARSLYPGIDCPQRHNNKVAGSGRLRRPSTQPAFLQKVSGSG